MKIEVHFLGQPEVILDGEKLQITQKKVEAMLLYLLFNGSCTREELAALFWCDCDEDGARRNLRGSLYKIRNLLGKDFLLAGGKSYIRLNPSVEVERDTDLFVTENSERKIAELADYCFLDKFYLKNCEEFEEWVRSMENTYDRLLTEKLLPAMRQSLKKGDYIQAERYAQSILRVDVHNEETVYLLMKIYEQSGEYNRAMFAYNRFSERLYQDMGLEPGPRMKAEYGNALRLKKERRATGNQGPFYIGHVEALAALNEEYSKCCQGFSYSNCVLCGETGMGKAEIWRRFLEECGKSGVMQLRFRYADRGVDYLAFHQILEKIADFLEIPSEERIADRGLNGNADLYFINAVERTALRLESRGKKGILLIHNLEYADEKSRALIFSCLFSRMSPMLFVAAGLNPCLYEGFSGFQSRHYDRNVRVLSLEPLKNGECLRYVKECLKKESSVLMEEGELYRYTGGNLLLLKEVADNLNEGRRDCYHMGMKAEERFLGLLKKLGGGRYEYLEYLAVLEHGVEAGTFGVLLQENSFSVIRELDDLLACGFLEPFGQAGHDGVKIRIRMVRELLYRGIADFKKKELHRQAYRYYETVYEKKHKDLFIWTELKYHAAGGGFAPASLLCDVGCLRYILDYIDEFFPVIPEDVEQIQAQTFTRMEMYEMLDEFGDRLESLRDELGDACYQRTRMELLYLRGRALNRDGKREDGLRVVERLIHLAEQAGSEEMLLNGYMEVLCYGVKAEDPVIMEQYLEKVGRLESLSPDQPEYGTVMRLTGYCHILRKEYDEAEVNLKESVRIFLSPALRGRYYYRAAGAYDYLAITYRLRGQFDLAERALEQAISLCTERGARKGLDLFYGDFAYLLFLEGRQKEAEEYFRRSTQIYDDFGTYWMRSVGESCMAVTCLGRGEEKEALEHFRRAEIFSRKEKTKEELSVLDMARQKLKQARLLL